MRGANHNGGTKRHWKRHFWLGKRGAKAAQCTTYYGGVHLHPDRHYEAVRVSDGNAGWRDCAGFLGGLAGGYSGNFRRTAAAGWTLYPTGRVRAIRRDGSCLLSILWPAQLLARRERGD